jgi:hypothetical protein
MMPASTRILIGLSLLASALGRIQAAAGERWAQYSNTSEITGMAEDGGKVWLGSLGGLIRIDPVSAETTYFNQANSSLTDLGIRTVASDGKGQVAAVTRYGALAVFDGKSWSDPGTAMPLLGQYCLDAMWDASGAFWLLATDPATRLPSLFRKRGQQWNRYYLDGVDAMSGNPSTGFWYSFYLPSGFGHPSLQADLAGRIWASVLHGMRTKVFRVGEDGSMDTVAAPAPGSGPYFQLVVPDSGSPVWVGSSGMFRVAPGGLETIEPPVPVAFLTNFFSPRNRFARAADGAELWSLAPDRIHRRRSGVWDTLYASGKPTDYPIFLAQARGRPGAGLSAPDAYVASLSGIGTLAGDTWSLADIAKTPFPGQFDITAFPAGRGSPAMLFCTWNGVELFDSRSGSASSLYANPTGETRKPISLFTDRSGRIWASGPGFLGLLRGKEMEFKLPPDGRWYGTFASGYEKNSFMWEAPDGTLWFADSSRVFSAPGGNEDTRTWIEHPLPPPWTGKARITNIAGQKDGSLWVSAYVYTAEYAAGIVARFDGKTWAMHDHLPNDAFPAWNIQDLLCDGVGNVWLLFPSGLLQWDGSAWKQHPWPLSPLIPEKIVATALDGNGSLWAATASPETRLLRWADGWESVPDVGARMRTTLVNSMAFDGTGKLWLSTSQSGILVFDPAEAPVSGIARTRGAPRGRPALARASHGAWRVELPGSAEGGRPARTLDIRGQTLPSQLSRPSLPARRP